ncbi:PH domain-containing protein [Marinactinospora endophytica]
MAAAGPAGQAGTGAPHPRLTRVKTATLRPPRNRVSPRAVHVWTVRRAMGALIMTAGLAALVWAAWYFEWSWIPAPIAERLWWIPTLYGIYQVAATLVVPRWRYRVHRWEIAADVVYTRVGWLNRHWQLVPVGRIQTVDHTQDWLERLFGVATLVFQTASHEGSSRIEGLDAAQARQLSEELAARAGELRDDAT